MNCPPQTPQGRKHGHCGPPTHTLQLDTILLLPFNSTFLENKIKTQTKQMKNQYAQKKFYVLMGRPLSASLHVRSPGLSLAASAQLFV